MTISYKEFAKQTKQYITEVQNRCANEYGFGTYERFWYDQLAGEFTLINNDIVCVRAKFQSVGSFHPPTRSWVWAWGNDTVMPGTKGKLWTIKAFGEENGFEFLTVSELKQVGEKRARRLAAMAITILQAEGAYMFQADNGLIVYLALFGIQKVNQ